MSYECNEDHLARACWSLNCSKTPKIYAAIIATNSHIPHLPLPPPTAIYKAHANIKSPLPSHMLAAVRDVDNFFILLCKIHI